MNAGSSNNRHFGIRGFPKSCICGSPIALFTSKTQDNPGRPFYRCNTQKKDHYFRWVEECMLDELEDVIAKVDRPQDHVTTQNPELADLKELVQDLSDSIILLSRDVQRSKRIAISATGLLITVIAAVVYFKFT